MNGAIMKRLNQSNTYCTIDVGSVDECVRLIVHSGERVLSLKSSVRWLG
jgi:hypothetical protein